ncbi:hypothetical protein [Pseudaestuariivita atlantica]|uniref:Uncharacterized protein n=1 Tax=Pseudaestuariivita atlantica TaxID=1317121 RepID=A0A0L1JRI6_9RHOB|nr:hypothetical protein [Pseudaestuariivita atlantica]KNG94332.1 hypothetical protein ATO11_09030 [Pseudaestuariivita atlantica]
MKKLMIAAAALALSASAGIAGGHGQSKSGWNSYGAVAAPAGVRVQIICWRGPLKKVWVDKPKDMFINSLVDAGLDRTTATGVAFQVCRNPALVNNPAGLKAETMRLIQQHRSPQVIYKW